ncbi:MAG: flagellar basal body rod protein FlgC [Firmicutes bacterium RBG_13_65_8]|nr:MAG: flagellar basal body rod protein FlgC [Firmicutes bacterium RBG_13_65_8]
MRIFQAMDVSASGLTSERLRLDVISNNLANANSTRTPEGGPYVRQVAVVASRPAEPGKAGAGLAAAAGDPARLAGNGVRVLGIVRDPSPPVLKYDPSHPDADANGYVAMPNVNVVTEMVDMITAARAYEANVTALNASKQMILKALEIGRA